MADWFQETLHASSGIAQSLKIGSLLYEDKSEHQHVQIFDNPLLGRVLTLDGVVQTTEGDEFMYHEMIAHVPMLAHGAARDVLIIGGGDGGTLREVVKHDVARVTLVEIDARVIDMCKEYLPSLSKGAFDDPRLDLVIADGARFVAETANRYDVIIADSTDPIGPGKVLFTSAFYGHCKRCLNEGGVLVTQNGVPFLQPEELTRSAARLRPHFDDVSCYLIAVPTYYGGYMALGWASDDGDLRQVPLDVLAARFKERDIATRFYAPEMHVGSFGLPADVRGLIEG